jgi:hypothetical protein
LEKSLSVPPQQTEIKKTETAPAEAACADDDFDWSDERSVIITERVQAAIAVYPNEAGDLVIRQRAQYLIDREDLVIIIGAEHIEAFIKQVDLIAGIPHHVEPPPPGGPTPGYKEYLLHPGWTDPSIELPPAPKRRDTPDPSPRRDATAAERKRRQRERDRAVKDHPKKPFAPDTDERPPQQGGDPGSNPIEPRVGTSLRAEAQDPNPPGQ